MLSHLVDVSHVHVHVLYRGLALNRGPYYNFY